MSYSSSRDGKRNHPRFILARSTQNAIWCHSGIHSGITSCISWEDELGRINICLLAYQIKGPEMEVWKYGKGVWRYVIITVNSLHLKSIFFFYELNTSAQSSFRCKLQDVGLHCQVFPKLWPVRLEITGRLSCPCWAVDCWTAEAGIHYSARGDGRLYLQGLRTQLWWAHHTLHWHAHTHTAHQGGRDTENTPPPHECINSGVKAWISGSEHLNLGHILKAALYVVLNTYNS